MKTFLTRARFMEVQSMLRMAFLLLMVVPAGLIGQETRTAEDWLADFERRGLGVGLAQVILPCDPSNISGAQVLNGMLARPMDDERVLHAFGELSLIQWSECPDTRIDRWLAGAVLASLDRAGSPHWEIMMSAIAQRAAPSVEQPFLSVLRDSRWSQQQRTAALAYGTRGLNTGEYLALYFEIADDLVTPLWLREEMGIPLITSGARRDEVLRSLDAATLAAHPRAEGLIMGLGSLARGNIGAASAGDVSIARRLLSEASQLAPPVHKQLYLRHLPRGG